MTLQKSREAGSLAEALGRLVADLGGLDAAASATRIGVSTLHCHIDPDGQPSRLPLDVLMQLEGAAVGRGGRPLVTLYLARARGYACVPLQPAADGSWHGELAAAIRAGGAVADRVLSAQADGRLDAAEQRDCLAAIDELLEAAGLLRARLAAAVAPRVTALPGDGMHLRGSKGARG